MCSKTGDLKRHMVKGHSVILFLKVSFKDINKNLRTYGNMFQDSQLFDPGTGAENDVIWPTDKILIWYSSFSIWGKAIFF